MNKEDDTNWLKNGKWRVVDNSTAERFCHTITTRSIRPTILIISGSNWNDGELLHFITQVSKVHCDVCFALEDAYQKSEETTTALLAVLISERAK